MRILDLGDLHANWNWPHSRMEENGFPSRLNHLFSVLDQAARFLETDRIETLILGGDLLHRRHFITWRLYNPLYRKLYTLASRVNQTIIFPGNHDYEDLGGEHGLLSLRGLPNTVVVDQPRVIALKSGEEIGIVPYLDDPRAMVKAFETLPSGIQVFSHYAAAGCPLANDYWLDQPLKLGELDRFKRVFFNHVHLPGDQLGGKVVYVGAPLAFDFGDGDSEPRGGLLVTEESWWRTPFSSPTFYTCHWPRIPTPPPPPGGYLRILDVPADRVLDAKDAALRLGWLDGIPVAKALAPELRQVLTTGLQITENLIAEHVRARCPDLSAEEQHLLIEEGVSAWNEARG